MTGRLAETSIPLVIRSASVDDVPALEQLIERSARALSAGFYTPEQTEAAITHVFGVDSELVADGTYLVAEGSGLLLGCGGWSRRQTLFGGDRYGARQTGLLDPATEPARIRAFFVAPDAARAGVATALLAACEKQARAAGFGALSLMATLPGVPFYRRHGFGAETPASFELGGVSVEFVAMRKPI